MGAVNFRLSAQSPGIRGVDSSSAPGWTTRVSPESIDLRPPVPAPSPSTKLTFYPRPVCPNGPPAPLAILISRPDAS